MTHSIKTVKHKSNLLPGNLQKIFIKREWIINQEEIFFSNSQAQEKGFCIPICGVKLRKRLNLDMKECSKITQRKERYKEMWCLMTTLYLLIVLLPCLYCNILLLLSFIRGITFRLCMSRGMSISISCLEQVIFV